MSPCLHLLQLLRQMLSEFLLNSLAHNRSHDTHLACVLLFLKLARPRLPQMPESVYLIRQVSVSQLFCYCRRRSRYCRFQLPRPLPFLIAC